MMEFVGCKDLTVGAEWELQLLDSDTLDLSPGIESLLHSFPEHENVTPEFVQSCVEIKTSICANSAELGEQLRSTASEVLANCKQLGMDLAGGGTHPFCRRLAIITPLPRYKILADKHGFLAKNQLAFATHVHIGLPSGDDAIRTMRLLTPLLPILIALSANSPFWRGHETGFASYRRRLLAASSSYGIPPYFDNWQAFDRFLSMAKAAGSIETVKDIHWDIRPHPDFGTLEVRVMDSQSDVVDIEFLVALLRTIVAWILASPNEDIERTIPRRLSSWIDRENHFRASHWGMDAQLIRDTEGQTTAVTEYIGSLAAALSDTAKMIGEAAMLKRLQSVGDAQSGYRSQLIAYAGRSDTRDVVGYLREEFAKTLMTTHDADVEIVPDA